ncbi:uncharacterized protein LOC122293629 [Carya illinoinensis]|uniref:uncharacterized protein LOC122293629 n=1 Tax=Carya illinoinensis TaxID=32201 RepID=UPI001C722B3B|nr:uncharacterized protein LOC122293629 [Carya illinoinensis]
MTKIMVYRLAPVLGKIISKEQAEFILGRSIFDNMALAQELVQGINRKVRGGNVMLKIDMAKAHDRVNWKFLMDFLHLLGFSENWRNLVYNAISSPCYSIMLNGGSKGFFQASRGIRQGDPLSPYLFILSQEILSRMVNQQFRMGRIKCYHSGGGTLISHLLYADDVLVFTNGGKVAIRRIMEILHRYEEMSRQLTSPTKSTIYFSNSIGLDRKRDIKRLSDFVEGSWPCGYLGIYDRIRSIFSDFLWGSSSEIRKRKWVSWNVICKPVEEGGLGVRDLMEVQESLFMKFGWKLLKGDSLWAEFFKKKYIGQDHVYKAIQVQKGTRFWKGVAELMPRVIKNSKWLVGNGNVNFWMDNWVGCGPLHDFCPVIGNIGLKVTEVFDNRGPKLEVIGDLVPDEVMQLIKEAGIKLKPNNLDVLIWKHTVEGKFTMKSAWELSREKGQIYEWKKWLWQPNVQKKMSFFCWRAKRGAVPTDERVQWMNIPLVSKCQFCVIPDVESLNHVLCAGPEVQKKLEGYDVVLVAESKEKHTSGLAARSHSYYDLMGFMEV